MSDRDVRRAAVLARVVAGEVALVEVTPLLGVSYRQAKRLVQRYRRAGATGLVHGNVGRRSNRACRAAERERVLAVVAAHYSGPAAKGPGQRFGPTLVAEHLAREHGIAVAVPTLRRWMQAAGLWGRARKASPKHVRRARKAHFGELVQLDGSFHDWFEGRGASPDERPCVMTMIDDATGRTMLRFDREETTWAAAAILQRWIAAYGVPQALYTDWKTVYLRAPTTNELARGIAPMTQFGRMCEKLGIRLIGAASPQAKGRVERGHGTHQDRLIKKLRLEGIRDCAAANRYVAREYEAAHNARFAVAPASNADYHTPRALLAIADADVFCVETPRVVGNDYVVQYQRRGLQLDRRARGRVPAKSTVVVRETHDGRIRVIHRGREGGERECAWTEAVPRTPKPPPPAAEAAPVAPSQAARRRPSKPAADHPWHAQHGRWVEQARERQAARKHARPLAPA